MIHAKFDLKNEQSTAQNRSETQRLEFVLCALFCDYIRVILARSFSKDESGFNWWELMSDGVPKRARFISNEMAFFFFSFCLHLGLDDESRKPHKHDGLPRKLRLIVNQGSLRGQIAQRSNGYQASFYVCEKFRAFSRIFFALTWREFARHFF